MFFRPLYARRHQRLREAGLECGDGVFDDEEVDVRDLEDVVGQIAFEYALSSHPPLVQQEIKNKQGKTTNRERALMRLLRASR